MTSRCQPFGVLLPVAWRHHLSLLNIHNRLGSRQNLTCNSMVQLLRIGGFYGCAEVQVEQNGVVDGDSGEQRHPFHARILIQASYRRNQVRARRP